MSNRDKILNTVIQNQPPFIELPPIINYDQRYNNVVGKFLEVLRFIGGEGILVKDYQEVLTIIQENFKDAKRIVSTCKELTSIAEIVESVNDPHELANVDLFIASSNLAVAENGAIWVKDDKNWKQSAAFYSPAYCSCC